MKPHAAGKRRRAAAGAALLALALLGGCATVANPDPRDPWESYNRSMTRFNDAVDATLIKPAAILYKDLLPQPVRTGCGSKSL